MHTATIAGMAFTNAFWVLPMPWPTKWEEFDITRRANAVLLPYVVDTMPGAGKFVSPKYESYIAPEKYRQIAPIICLPPLGKVCSA